VRPSGKGGKLGTGKEGSTRNMLEGENFLMIEKSPRLPNEAATRTKKKGSGMHPAS